MENFKEKLRDGLKPLYEDLFNNLNIGFNRETDTAFVMNWGENFPTEMNTGILFVGKAVNGWAKKEDQSFEKLFARKDQMKWVEDLWDSKKNYVTKKSAFWRVIKGIIANYDKTANPWYSYIAWSNLYKISPNNSKGGGNPSKNEKDNQLALCRIILQKEIEILSPKYVILLTSGWESKTGFLWYLNGKQHTTHLEEITWSGKNKIRVYKINDTIFITSVHPQGKNEAEHVKQIINILNKY
jgi:hypothetical protein